MKIRNGFVSNSSSSSFIATLAISNANKTDVGFGYENFCIPIKDLLEMDSWDLNDKYEYSVPDELIILKNDEKDDFSVLYRTKHGDVQINNVVGKVLKDNPDANLEECFLMFDSEQSWLEGSYTDEELEEFNNSPWAEHDKKYNKDSIIHKSSIDWNGYA